jgi:hypothetical protein
MQQWEYKIIEVLGHAQQEAELNELGADGWELVCLYVSKLYLKRLKT